MFHEPWFWISFAGFFFNSNFYYYRSKGTLNGTKASTQEMWATISMLGIFIFWLIGLFVANRWWQPLAAFGISMIGSGLVGPIIEAILPRSASVLVGAISPFVSLGLTIAAYIVWY